MAADFSKFRKASFPNSTVTRPNSPNSVASYSLSKMRTFWTIQSTKTSVTLCMKCSTISGENILCCSRILLTAKVASRFKKCDSFLRMLCKNGFKWGNNGNHRPIPNSATYRRRKIEIPRKWANSPARLKILRPTQNCGP